MALPFRRRIFFILVAMAVIPTGLAVVGWVLSVRTGGPASGARASLEQVAASARVMLERVDTLRLSPGGRLAVRDHLDEISRSLTLARRADTYLRYLQGSLVVIVILLGVMVVYAAVRVAGHVSRQLSRPIDELVGWTNLIRMRTPLPDGPPSRGAPEFAALRQSLRELPAALETARVRELEAERLRAFREVARRVAHEIKNPLTSIRIAVDQLGRSPTASDPRASVAVEVLAAETDRLERLAREFADFGRLPEGPASEVDILELLAELGRTAVPEGVQVKVSATTERHSLRGHYEPLRRAFSNLLRNAAEAMGGRGVVDVTVSGNPGGLRVDIADHGPGVPPDLRNRVFEPYVTTKPAGTGLGLALVKQTVEQHQGSIRLSETPGGGATFELAFPA